MTFFELVVDVVQCLEEVLGLGGFEYPGEDVRSDKMNHDERVKANLPFFQEYPDCLL